jgi:uncharacterized lipoprotein YbaY
MIRLSALSVFALFLLAACSARGPAPDLRRPSVAGTVVAETDVTVPSNAVLEIRLMDITAGAPPTVVTEQVSSNPGPPPYRFRLFYQTAAIESTRDYAVQVRLLVAGRPLLVQPAPAPVLTKGRPVVVEIRLRPPGTS